MKQTPTVTTAETFVFYYALDAVDENGCVEAPDGPGLGCTFDWDYITSHTPDTSSWGSLS